MDVVSSLRTIPAYVPSPTSPPTTPAMEAPAAEGSFGRFVIHFVKVTSAVRTLVPARTGWPAAGCTSTTMARLVASVKASSDRILRLMMVLLSVRDRFPQDRASVACSRRRGSARASRPPPPRRHRRSSCLLVLQISRPLLAPSLCRQPLGCPEGQRGHDRDQTDGQGGEG